MKYISKARIEIPLIQLIQVIVFVPIYSLHSNVVQGVRRYNTLQLEV